MIEIPSFLSSKRKERRARREESARSETKKVRVSESDFESEFVAAAAAAIRYKKNLRSVGDSVHAVS